MTVALLGEDGLRRIAEAALRAAKGDQAQATVSARTVQLTRFANNAIHQNVASREATLQIRVVKGKRVSTIRTSDIGEEGIARAAGSASELADRVPENPVFAALPPARPIPPGPTAFVDRTAAATPLDRARLAERICRASKDRGFRTAGYVSTNVTELAIATTEGVWAYAPQSLAKAECVVMGDAGSAWSERTSTDLARVDVGAMAGEAVAKCAAAQAPRDMPPGTYEVVLEPYAVSDIVSFLGGALSGQSVEEGRSFVGGRLGEKVTGEVTLVDDPFDADGMPRAFDFDGQPAQAVTLIDRGVARAVVYDWQTASRTGNASTGHALPPNPFQSCAPMHTRLEPGTLTREELIKGVKRGVLVTRFHYTRWVHQLRTIVTGMTRDGTFLIENGEIAHPVKNFRFTQSYHDALGGTLGVGRDLHLFGGGEFEIGGSRRVPALRLGAFAFTGATQF